MRQRIKIVSAGRPSRALALFGLVVAGPLEDGKAAYKSGDYATAVRLLRPLADLGNADAQNNLGAIYYSGHGVPQDYAQAAEWYRRAANQGGRTEQAALGWVYEEGQGVPQDYAQAAIWYRKAANRGTSQRITISAWHTITGWACRKTMWSSQVVPEGCRSGLRRRANRPRREVRPGHPSGLCAGPHVVQFGSLARPLQARIGAIWRRKTATKWRPR
jgi:TPR repeat protein